MGNGVNIEYDPIEIEIQLTKIHEQLLYQTSHLCSSPDFPKVISNQNPNTKETHSVKQRSKLSTNQIPSSKFVKSVTCPNCQLVTYACKTQLTYSAAPDRVYNARNVQVKRHIRIRFTIQYNNYIDTERIIYTSHSHIYCMNTNINLIYMRLI